MSEKAAILRENIVRNAMALHMGLTRAQLDEYLNPKEGRQIDVEASLETNLKVADNEEFRTTLNTAVFLSVSGTVDRETQNVITDIFLLADSTFNNRGFNDFEDLGFDAINPSLN